MHNGEYFLPTKHDKTCQVYIKNHEQCGKIAYLEVQTEGGVIPVCEKHTKTLVNSYRDACSFQFHTVEAD